MCIFSLPVTAVRATKIFVRNVHKTAEPGLQAVIYEASVEADQEVAMILPLPCVEPEIRFYNMQTCPKFFTDVEYLFHMRSRGGTRGMRSDMDRDGLREVLKVERVGSFDASYVPTAGDFDRLDARFRIPAGVFDLHPEYRAGFGFAVFKLRDAAHLPHPMALVFKRREDCPGLFVPTTHAHGAETPGKKEEFDHCIYAQLDGGFAPGPVFGTFWTESERKVEASAGAPPNTQMADYAIPGRSIFKLTLRGLFDNRDVLVVAA
jgi:hypothetical protein